MGVGAEELGARPGGAGDDEGTGVVELAEGVGREAGAEVVEFGRALFWRYAKLNPVVADIGEWVRLDDGGTIEGTLALHLAAHTSVANVEYKTSERSVGKVPERQE